LLLKHGDLLLHTLWCRIKGIKITANHVGVGMIGAKSVFKNGQRLFKVRARPFQVALGVQHTSKIIQARGRIRMSLAQHLLIDGQRLFKIRTCPCVAVLIFLFVWFPTMLCVDAAATAQVSKMTPSPATDTISAGSRTSNQCRNLFGDILPVYPTPTPDPRTNFQKIVEDLDAPEAISGRKVFIVQSAGPLDWLAPGSELDLVFVPVFTSPEATPELAGADVTSMAESIHVIVLDINQPQANGWIPLLVAVADEDFERAKRVMGRAIAYPAYTVPEVTNTVEQ
jgi:hypothetical protein